MDVTSLVYGIGIGYIGSLVSCYIDSLLRRRDLQSFFLECNGLELVPDDEEDLY